MVLKDEKTMLDTSFDTLPEGAYMVDDNVGMADLVQPGMLVKLSSSTDSSLNPDKYYTVLKRKRGRPVVLREDGRYETLYNFELEHTDTKLYNVFWGQLARIDWGALDFQRFRHYEFKDNLVYVEKEVEPDRITSSNRFKISIEGITGTASVNSLSPVPYEELYPEEANVEGNMDSGYVEDSALDFTLGDWVTLRSDNNKYYFVVSLTPTKETVIVKPEDRYLDSLSTEEMQTKDLTYAGAEFNRLKWEEFGKSKEETVTIDGEGYKQVFEKPKKDDFVHLDYQGGYSLFVDKADEYGNLYGIERKGNRNCYVYGHLNPVGVYRRLKEGE